MFIRSTLASVGFCAGALLAPLASGGEPPFPNELAYPNIVQPIHQFGTHGSRPGEFIDPSGVALGSDHLVYVADTSNHRVQVLKLDGSPVSSIGRVGAEPGQFIEPRDVAVTESELYVLDAGNSRVQVFDKRGKWLRSFGEAGSGKLGLRDPSGIAVCPSSVAVADSGNHRVQLWSRQGRHIQSIGGHGSAPGSFRNPMDVTCDERGQLYVADSDNNRIQKFDAHQKLSLVWGEWGSHAGQLATPVALQYHAGQVFVAELINHRLQVFEADGKFAYQWGRHPATAHEGDGRVHYPAAIAAGPGAHTVVCEPIENRCQVFDRSNLASVQNVNDSAWWDKATRFHYGTSAEVAAGRPWLFINEPDTHSVLVFDIAGQLPTFLTRIGVQGSGAGQLIQPSGVLFLSASDEILVSDRGNRRLQAFRVPANVAAPRLAASTAVVQDRQQLPSAATFVRALDARALFAAPPAPAGTPRPSLPTDVAPRPPLRISRPDFTLEQFEPGSMALGPNGDVYLLDPGNLRVHIFASDLSYKSSFGAAGSGPGQFKKPLQLAVGRDGKVYVADQNNFRVSVFGADGKHVRDFGGPSEFVGVFGIDVDAKGNVYTSDQSTNEIKKFDAAGKLQRRWGTWGVGTGEFYKPKGVAVDPKGRLFVMDFGNHRGQIFDTNGKYVNMFGVGNVYTQPKADQPRRPPHR